MRAIILTNSPRTVAPVTFHYYIAASPTAEKNKIYLGKITQIKYREVVLELFNCYHVTYSLFKDAMIGSDYVASNGIIL
jgi:hypothetical protein